MTDGASRPARLVIFSSHGDLHGAVVAMSLLRQRENPVDVRIVDLDAASTDGGIRWTLESGRVSGVELMDNLGVWFDLATADLVWCRRFTRPQRSDPGCGEGGSGYLTSQWRQAARLIATQRGPRWCDHPDTILSAESKPAQLHAAIGAGFLVPDTLVTQDPEAIAGFFERHDGQVVVKPLKGHVGQQLYTLELTRPMIEDAAVLRTMPCIYQRLVPGDRHLRVVVLGSVARAFEIRSRSLDWRQRDGFEVRPAGLDDELLDRCRAVLSSLGLTMGVFDCKIGPGGEPWFLEVNPQGQFLFLEALTGVPLAPIYAQHLAAALDVAVAGCDEANT